MPDAPFRAQRCRLRAKMTGDPNEGEEVPSQRSVLILELQDDTRRPRP